MATIEEVAEQVSPDFKDLKEAYPVAFSEFPSAGKCLTTRDLVGVPQGDPRRAESDRAWREAYAYALRRGRDRYIAEACWHCHSQYVRPVSNEEIRYGAVRTPAHDNNALQRPMLWGTRRVGPDLTHEGGKRSNDWHAAHLWDPQSTSPDSVMPKYRWLFTEGHQVRRTIDPELADRGGLSPTTSYPFPGVYATRAEAESAMEKLRSELPEALAAERGRLMVAEGRAPDAEGLSLISYLQWLGTWEPPHLAEVSR